MFRKIVSPTSSHFDTGTVLSSGSVACTFLRNVGRLLPIFCSSLCTRAWLTRRIGKWSWYVPSKCRWSYRRFGASLWPLLSAWCLYSVFEFVLCTIGNSTALIDVCGQTRLEPGPRIWIVTCTLPKPGWLRVRKYASNPRRRYKRTRTVPTSAYKLVLKTRRRRRRRRGDLFPFISLLKSGALGCSRS